MKTNLLKIGFVCAALFIGVFQAAALDGIVIANENVSVASLDASALKDIYCGKTMYWEGGQAVVIIVAGDKGEAAIEQASGMNASTFKTFWQRLAFSGRGQQPKKANDAAATIALVASTKGAIAIVPTGTKLDGVKTITIK